MLVTIYILYIYIYSIYIYILYIYSIYIYILYIYIFYIYSIYILYIWLLLLSLLLSLLSSLLLYIYIYIYIQYIYIYIYNIYICIYIYVYIYISLCTHPMTFPSILTRGLYPVLHGASGLPPCLLVGLGRRCYTRPDPSTPGPGTRRGVASTRWPGRPGVAFSTQKNGRTSVFSGDHMVIICYSNMVNMWISLDTMITMGFMANVKYILIRGFFWNALTNHHGDVVVT